MQTLTMEETITKQKDMSVLAFDPPDGFTGKNIFPDPVTTPTYMELWEVEKNLNFHEWRMWIGAHYKLPVHLCFLYVMGIFLGQIFMRRKPAYKLNQFMIIWNVALAGFSLAGFFRSYPEVLHLLYRSNGFYRITCSRYVGRFSYFFRELMELGDTAFIVLRKKPVIFLHWFHHATVMCYTWSTFEYLDPSHRWYTVMNYFIHAIMYSYYALRAMRFTLNKKVSMIITALQLCQMIAGVGINVYSIIKINEGTPCARKLQNVQMVLLMYTTYLVLFAQFFYSSYITPKNKNDTKDRCHCE
ncbi:putative fatty acid elongation protein 3 [Folsomia candida]|uniref:Elongation of very long chain fatty acids protein n=1 Tax=Folsomia candida TaxID=158441 RepID=A0A226DMT0_FOLCA|nr:putative fatty acid elongation protein 3 [Folsomia candida]